LKNHSDFFITFRRQALQEKPPAHPYKEKHYNLSKHWIYEHRSNNRLSQPTGLEYTNCNFLSYIISEHNKLFKAQW